jgi:hypothetical protein
MSLLDYAEINSEHLILTKPSQKTVIEAVEGLSTDLNQASLNTLTLAPKVEADLAKAIPALTEYSALSVAMNADTGRVYSQNPRHSTDNPVNDPISHEYIPRINEAALADIQSRLDFQNRVYAYTAVGLISVIIGGIMFNSTK